MRYNRDCAAAAGGGGWDEGMEGMGKRMGDGDGDGDEDEEGRNGWEGGGGWAEELQ